MKYKKLQNKRGFTLLFAVTVSAILLAIALGVADIAFKEVKFGTNARDTNEAFFAADSGVEYVLFQDKPGSTPYVLSPPNSMNMWGITLTGLGSTGKSCAIVSITKDGQTSPPDVFTTIISRGYNTGGDDPSCASSNPDRIERELRVSY
jgi:hypothetical protein